MNSITQYMKYRQSLLIYAQKYGVELQYILDRGKKRVRLERPSGIVELQHN